MGVRFISPQFEFSHGQVKMAFLGVSQSEVVVELPIPVIQGNGFLKSNNSLVSFPLEQVGVPQVIPYIVQVRAYFQAIS